MSEVIKPLKVKACPCGGTVRGYCPGDWCELWLRAALGPKWRSRWRAIKRAKEAGRG